jgi:hypothetical protein
MDLRNGFCVVALLTTLAAQPALAAGAADRSTPQAPRLADVPMKGAAAEAAAGTLVSTPGDEIGFHPGELLEPKACPPPGNATFTWTIIDGCADGLGIYARFFDETNDLVYPNTTQVYSIGSNRSGTVRLSVKRGAKICFGAEPSNRDGNYWGVSLDNDQACPNCCNIVPNTGNISRTVRLTC